MDKLYDYQQVCSIKASSAQLYTNVWKQFWNAVGMYRSRQLHSPLSEGVPANSEVLAVAVLSRRAASLTISSTEPL